MQKKARTTELKSMNYEAKGVKRPRDRPKKRWIEELEKGCRLDNYTRSMLWSI